jgi:hypothetical protein
VSDTGCTDAVGGGGAFCESCANADTLTAVMNVNAIKGMKCFFKSHPQQLTPLTDS